jgi:hypothetical protein
MQIGEEAVEAAAKALWGHGEMPEFGWDQLDRVSKKVSLDEARAALEAAAPHMCAGAKADAWDEGWGEDTLSKFSEANNPYRSQA